LARGGAIRLLLDRSDMGLIHLREHMEDEGDERRR
jgi:hypothetical protein